jgi:hypothetical protein
MLIRTTCLRNEDLFQTIKPATRRLFISHAASGVVQRTIEGRCSHDICIVLLPYCAETQYSFTLGLHAQYYVTNVCNVVAPWNPTITGCRGGHNPVSLGIELETGGHFFKVILSNTDLLNPTQFLTGAPDADNDGKLRIGFNITRVLVF